MIITTNRINFLDPSQGAEIARKCEKIRFKQFRIFDEIK